MEINKSEYVGLIEDNIKWKNYQKSFNGSPYNSDLRKKVSKELFDNPASLAGQEADIVDSYITGKNRQLEGNLLEKTKNNLSEILKDVTSDLSLDEAVDFLLNTKPSSDEKYHGLTNVHNNYLESIRNIGDEKREPKINEIKKDIVNVYGLDDNLKGAIEYHASANPEGLIKIYINTVVKKRKEELKDQLKTKEEKLNKNIFKGYVNNIVKDDDVSLFLLANLAYIKYKAENKNEE